MQPNKVNRWFVVVVLGLALLAGGVRCSKTESPSDRVQRIRAQVDRSDLLHHLDGYASKAGMLMKVKHALDALAKVGRGASLAARLLGDDTWNGLVSDVALVSLVWDLSQELETVARFWEGVEALEGYGPTLRQALDDATANPTDATLRHVAEQAARGLTLIEPLHDGVEKVLGWLTHIAVALPAARIYLARESAGSSWVKRKMLGAVSDLVELLEEEVTEPLVASVTSAESMLASDVAMLRELTKVGQDVATAGCGGCGGR